MKKLSFILILKDGRGLSDLKGEKNHGRENHRTHRINRTYTSYTLHPNIICESPDENAIASLVAEDFGIALVADVAILDHFKLEKLHLSDVTLHHTVYLAYLRGHYQIPAVRNFISFIKKEGTSL